MRRDGGVGYARRGRAHEHFGLGELARHRLGYGGLDHTAHVGRREDEAVVAVDGALYAAGPGEGLLRPEEHRADGQKAAGHALFYFVHAFAPPMNSETQRLQAATGSSAPVMGRPTTM